MGLAYQWGIITGRFPPRGGGTNSGYQKEIILPQQRSKKERKHQEMRMWASTPPAWNGIGVGKALRGRQGAHWTDTGTRGRRSGLEVTWAHTWLC